MCIQIRRFSSLPFGDKKLQGENLRINIYIALKLGFSSTFDTYRSP